MKNASTSKSNNIESPKTPGGISKSLLTPCRRLGLSRNWKKGGPSPFISPLAGSSEVKQEIVETRKRKERSLDGECSKTPNSPNVGDKFDNAIITELNNKNTPCRTVDLPRRKKSKTLLSVINDSQATVSSQSPIKSISIHNNASEENNENTCELTVAHTTDVSTPSRTENKITNHITPSKSSKEKQNLESLEQNSHDEPQTIVNNKKHIDELQENDRIEGKKKERSPNDLKKECMVLIQKKIFKTEIIDDEMHHHSDNIKLKNNETMTQALFDSDSDDVPLNNLTLKPSEPSQHNKDYCVTKLYTKKAKDKNSHKSKDIPKKLKNSKVISKPNTIDIKSIELLNDDDDDDDDFADSKKTILIRKTYAKVTKPSKAKSTGSITQRDIDELKARIEVKKKLLLAKAMTEDTKELRDLIKKWQKGCQDALMELMDLMKNKFPDKSNMDYSEILQTLKIPASLVGYDADEDCFNTPDDTSIVLANLNDL